MHDIGCTSCHIQNLTLTHDRRVADAETVYDPTHGIFNRLFATASTLFEVVPDSEPYPQLLPQGKPFVVENIFTDFKGGATGLLDGCQLHSLERSGRKRFSMTFFLHCCLWPDNVRELQNAIERAVVLSPGSEISATELPSEVRCVTPAAGEEAGGVSTETLMAVNPAVSEMRPMAEAMDAYQRALVRKALEVTGDSQTEAARLLSVSQPSLSRLMKRLRLRGRSCASRTLQELTYGGLGSLAVLDALRLGRGRGLLRIVIAQSGIDNSSSTQSQQPEQADFERPHGWGKIHAHRCDSRLGDCIPHAVLLLLGRVGLHYSLPKLEGEKYRNVIVHIQRI